MNNKLTLADIVDALASRKDISKKESENFLRELLDILTENVARDSIVKLRDFGTFKVVDVSSRESVDVNTGAKIEIASHKKISFVPDKTLKELVNKPFALFEPELLNEGVNFELLPAEPPTEEDVEEADTDLEMTETVVESEEVTSEPVFPAEPDFRSSRVSQVFADLRSEEEVATGAETDMPEELILDAPQEYFLSDREADKPAPAVEKKEVVEMPLPTPETPSRISVAPHPEVKVSEEEVACGKELDGPPAVQVSDSSEHISSQSTVANNVQPFDTVAEEVTEESTAEVEVKEKQGMKKLWLVAGACLALLVVGVLVFSFFNVSDNKPSEQIVVPGATNSVPSQVQPAPKPNVVVVNKSSEATKVSTSAPVPAVKDSVKKEQPKSTVPAAAASVKEQPVVKTATKPSVKSSATATVSGGDTFRTLALKHYGSKDFWVYIYQANKVKAPNPNVLHSGLTVTIPDAASLGIDASSAASIKKAKQLSEKVMTEYNNSRK